eukprot:748670-Hanusia_phi.AAC.4
MGGGGQRRGDFFHSEQQEPHAPRKEKILKAHPEIKQLMRHEPLTKYIVFLSVSAQVALAVLTREWSWLSYLAVVYVVGATINHSLFLAIHELSHNLGFKKSEHNKLCGIFANLPIGIPYSITFKPYHMEHHRYQGEEGVDTDIPTALEAWLITKTSHSYVEHTAKKAVFMFFQIFAYAFRPMCVKPSLVPRDSWIVLNWAVQIGFDVGMMYLFGVKVMLYLLLSTFFAGSIHPTAGHFIAEHYVMEGTAETYSYYGWLNWLAYNVGYHNEHHDFPNIPWSNLPKVKCRLTMTLPSRCKSPLFFLLKISPALCLSGHDPCLAP